MPLNDEFLFCGRQLSIWTYPYPDVTMNPYDVLPRVEAAGTPVRAQFPQLYRPGQSVGRGHRHSTRFAYFQLSARPFALRSLLDLCVLQLANISGWVVDRFNVGWVLAGGFFLWSAATAFTGIAHTFALLFAMRLLLGIGESIAYPSYSRILATYFSANQRGLANALIDAGTKIGPAFGTLLGGFLMARYGWRAFFVVLGSSTMLWLIPWLAWMPRGKGVTTAKDTVDGPSAMEIFC